MFQVFKPETRELFNRDGTRNTRVFAVDPKGRPWTSYVGKCNRCGGAGGADKWAYTGWTCFDCRGSGKGWPQHVHLYTCEELAKLNERKAKADATRAAKRQAAADKAQAEADARRADFMAVHGALIERAKPHMEDEFIADVIGKGIRYAQFSPAQADAVAKAIDRIEERARKRAASGYVGSVGERLELEVTVERVSSFQRPAFNAPWTTETVWVAGMRDSNGNALVSMGSFSAEKGETFTIRGTVKEHSVYNEEKQTKLSRVMVYVPKAKKGKVAYAPPPDA